MKQFVFGILAVWLLGACQKDLDTYSGVDYIYFEGTSDSIFFSYAYVDGKINRDTIWAWVRLSGKVTDYERAVKIKVAETNGVAGVDFEALPESYAVEPGRTFVAAPIVLLRPEALRNEERYLVLELQESDEFRLMWPSQPVNTSSDKRYSKIRYKIVFSEILNTAPKGWDDLYFGTFSVKKFDKMCLELNIDRQMFNDITYIKPRKDYIGSKMFQILKANPVYEDDDVTLMRMGDRYYK